jgi:hypothetical protein
MRKMGGAMRLTPQAIEWYDDWYYNKHIPEIRRRDLGSQEVSDTGYWGRRSEHVIRVAMIYSAAESSEHITTEAGKRQYWCRTKHLQRAVRHLKEVESRFDDAFGEIGTHAGQDFDVKVLEFLARHEGKVPRYKVMQHLIRYGGASRLDQAERNLLESRKIRVFRRKHTGGILYALRR